VIYLLDTNTCIGYLNGTAVGILQQLQTLSPQEIAVCSVVKAELFYGAMKSANPTKTLALQRQFAVGISKETLPMVELTWEGKYDADGKRTALLHIQLPFQTVETVNENAQQRHKTLDLFSAGRGRRSFV